MCFRGVRVCRATGVTHSGIMEATAARRNMQHPLFVCNHDKAACNN